jgi:hypothetical protein
MLIGKTYERILGNGDRTTVVINTQREKEYHEELEASGCQYKEINISSGLDVCLSCQA